MRTFKPLMAALAIAALAGGRAIAQQATSDTGTDANGPSTILKNMQPEPAGVLVDVNGEQVDDLRAASYDDITTSVHRGSNTLLVRWSGPITRLDLKIAYAATRNNFKTVTVVQANAARDAALRRAGSRTVTFTIPG
jgi:hypothetical protein